MITHRPAIEPSIDLLSHNIPNELKALRQWLPYALVTYENYRDDIKDKPRKQPVKVIPSIFNAPPSVAPVRWSDDSTYLSFDEALTTLAAYPTLLAGIGIVLQPDDNIAYIDVDNIAQAENDSGDGGDQLKQQCLTYLKPFTHLTYSEYSQSNNGLHIFFHYSEEFRRINTTVIELYPGSSRAFVAVTGNLVDPTATPTTLLPPYEGDELITLAQEIARTAPNRQATTATLGQAYTPPLVAPEGTRDTELFRYLCHRLSVSVKQDAPLTYDQLQKLANSFNSQRCDPPLSQKEVDAKVRSAWRYHMRDDAATAATQHKYTEQQPQPSAATGDTGDDDTDDTDDDDTGRLLEPLPDDIDWRVLPNLTPIIVKSNIASELIFIKNQNKFFDCYDRTIMTSAGLDNAFKRYFKKVKPSTWITSQHNLAVVSDGLWKPYPYKKPTNKSRESVVYHNNLPYLNSFRYRVSPKKGNAQPWLDLLAHLCPNVEYRSALLWYYAYTVQFPHLKCQWHPVMLSIEGAGKDSLIKPIYDIIPTKSISTRDFQSPYDDYLYENKLIIINESKGLTEDDYEYYKQLTTNEGGAYRQINPKSKGKVEHYDCWHVVIHANHLGAFKISGNDRRSLVLYADTPLSISQANAYYAWYNDPDAASYLFDYLLHYDLKDHTPQTLPYRTSYVDMMLQETASDLDILIYDLIADHDVMLPELIAPMLPSNVYDRQRKITEVLNSSGWERWDRGEARRIQKKVDDKVLKESSKWYIRKTHRVEYDRPVEMYDACQDCRAKIEKIVEERKKF